MIPPGNIDRHRACGIQTGQWKLVDTTLSFGNGEDSGPGTRQTALYCSSKYRCGLAGGAEWTPFRYQYHRCDGCRVRSEVEPPGEMYPPQRRNLSGTGIGQLEPVIGMLPRQ